ncbi:MAG: hypothetical protein K6G12_07945 [Lachnospiraceae bacterium]|nr:hypothetical protein [Lachnospiraceae bacterium]
MIDFEEELKKFHPSLEVEDVSEAIYNQDLTDMADLIVAMIKDTGNIRKKSNGTNEE